MRTLRLPLTLIAIASLVSGCAAPEASEPKGAQPVRTEIVAPTLPEPGVRYSASIEAFEQVPVAFKATGYVDDILRRSGADGRLRTAQPGDRVTRGTVLARVRDTDYRERVNQGRARLAEGEASLTKARLDLERAKTLFAAESLTKPELDAAQAGFDAAEARIAAARADIELALIALRDCELVSPASGTILERRIEAGALAGSGAVAFVLGDLSSVKARFGVPDSMIQSIRLGGSIDVTVEAVAEATFAGRVTAVAPAADPQSRVFDVEVTIPNQDGRLRPGMIGTVAIGAAAGAARSAANPSLAVPLTAIVRSEAGANQFAVLVVGSQNGVDIVHRRAVELGDVMGNVIEVRKGVTEGERVVVSGATLLVDGDPVRLLQ